MKMGTVDSETKPKIKGMGRMTGGLIIAYGSQA